MTSYLQLLLDITNRRMAMKPCASKAMKGGMKMPKGTSKKAGNGYAEMPAKKPMKKSK